MIATDLFESLSRIVYHYTSLDNAVSILSSGEFQLSSIAGSMEDTWAPKGYHYFLSTTRTKFGDFHDTVGNGGVMFDLDGNYYNTHYKSAPVDYWGSRDKSSAKWAKVEAEDRIFSKTPTIPIDGVTSIHVYVKPMDTKERQNFGKSAPGWARKVLILAKKRGIPAYFYEDLEAWRSQNPKGRVPITKRDTLSGPDLYGEINKRRSISNRPNREFTPWFQLINLDSTAKLGKEARGIAWNLGYDHEYYNKDIIKGLSNSFFNARKPGSGNDRESAVKILTWMQQHKLHSVTDFVNFLSKKWKAIKQEENTRDRFAHLDETQDHQDRIVYHGNQGGLNLNNIIAPMWWTETKADAYMYASQNDADGWVYSAKLSCNNPYVIGDDEEPNTILNAWRQLAAEGYDCIYDEEVGDWIPFYSKDIHIIDRESVDTSNNNLDEGWQDVARAGALSAALAGGSAQAADNPQFDAVPPGHHTVTINNQPVVLPGGSQMVVKDGTPQDKIIAFLQTKFPDILKNLQPQKTQQELPRLSTRPSASMVQMAKEMINSTYGKYLVRVAKIHGLENDELYQFLAQTAHESAKFQKFQEDLDYTASRLMEVFPKVFDKKTAKKYAHHPEAIANRAYAGVNGNGDEASGDGWNYRGRGFIHLTGKENYAKAGKAIGQPLLQHPEYAAKPEVAAQVALWFWDNRVASKTKDYSDTVTATKPINKGLEGLTSRHNKFLGLKNILSKQAKK
jgi:putative chitinase